MKHLIVILSVALVLVACDSDGSTTEPTTTEPAATTEPATTEPTIASCDDVDRVGLSSIEPANLDDWCAGYRTAEATFDMSEQCDELINGGSSSEQLVEVFISDGFDPDGAIGALDYLFANC